MAPAVEEGGLLVAGDLGGRISPAWLVAAFLGGTAGQSVARAFGDCRKLLPECRMSAQLLLEAERHAAASRAAEEARRRAEASSESDDDDDDDEDEEDEEDGPLPAWRAAWLQHADFSIPERPARPVAAPRMGGGGGAEP